MQLSIRFHARQALDAAGLLPAAFNAWRSLAEWRPSMVVRNARHRRIARRAGVPLPPSDLVFSVAGSRDLEWFASSGLAAATSLADSLESIGRPFDSFDALLDFGCGCGRVLRHLSSLQSVRVHGCDYNRAAISWSRRYLPFARLATNDLRPPLPYEDGTFDLVYALSVFTHLPLDLQRAWLTELRRVLRPGGVLVVSLLGEHYLPRLTADEHERFRAGQPVVRNEQRAGTNLCAAYHPMCFVRDQWGAGFAMRVFRPEGALGNPHQDLYVFERSQG